MRKWYISEMDARAQSLAARAGMGVEIIDFCIPENLDNRNLPQQRRVQLQQFSLTLHAPYSEIFPSAIDPMMRKLAMHRLLQAANISSEMKIARMIAHSGFAPQMYYPEWFVPRSIEFWREFLSKVPSGVEIALENVLDTQPEYIAQICDEVGDARLKICLDVGHVNAYSPTPVEAWIRILGERIAHVHLHNNDASRDSHSALALGSMNILKLLTLLDFHAPQASICIESMDALSCLKFLNDGGIIDVQSL